MNATSASAWDAPALSEALYSIENYQRDTQACREPSEIVALTAGYLRRLRFFEINALWLTEAPEWTFRLGFCEPRSEEDQVQEMVQGAIRSGTFAWALKQARFVTLPNQTAPNEPPLILHSIGTRSRTSGMFVGRKPGGTRGDDQRPLGALSLILSCMASALENIHLQWQIGRQNASLREAVQERTRELTLANQALAEEKELLALTFRFIREGIIATDDQGRVQMMNPAATQLTGRSESSVRGILIDKIIPTIYWRDHSSPLPWLEALRTSSRIQAERCRFMLENGDELPVAFVLYPFKKECAGRVGTLLVFRDLTEELQRESEQIKTSKLESLGILAGGIAHDFNNLLTVVLGNISLARHLEGPEGPALSCLIESENACVRARDLTQQLLTFAKGGVPIKKTAYLQDTIRESTHFALHGSNVRAEFSFAADLRPVEADLGQITQVIQNIVLNAAQAMAGGGVLKVFAENRGTREGERVAILVQDTGIGIRPEDLARVFDPYFTTKENGHGLGLATCYSIVKNHAGEILAESRLGIGTVFTVLLPCSSRALPPVPKAPLSSAASRPARVLVMDDEEAMRLLLKRLLERMGHAVVLTEHGKQAVEAYGEAARCGDGFDLVILDLTIPGGMGGFEAMRQLRELDAGVTAIVSSGYASDPVMGDYEKHGFKAVVPKPYSLEELRRAVESLLTTPA